MTKKASSRRASKTERAAPKTSIPQTVLRIVNTALEGYSTFRRCGIDALVAGPAIVTKRATASAKREHVA